MNSTCIIIPTHQNVLSKYELISLQQCIKILGDYPVVMVVPEKYYIEYLLSIINKTDNILIEKFSDSYFYSTTGYNNLLVSRSFYERFEKYEYMLIHQLDAFVFRDELPYWTSFGFSYVGAPWFEQFEKGSSKSNFIEFGGNGGLSLRRVKSYLDVLTIYESIEKKSGMYGIKTKFRELLGKILRDVGKKKIVKRLNEEDLRNQDLIWLINLDINKYSKEYIMNLGVHEDLFWSYIAPAIDPNFRVARYDVEIRFAFECQPSRLYDLNNRRLPFGCHAWEKYEPEFWKPFIQKCGYEI